MEIWINITGILLGTFIAYHVYFLSKKLSNQARLIHKDAIKQRAEELLGKILREGLRSKVYLVNLRRYFKDYPSNSEKIFNGYSHIGAEIKAARFDGLEFFSGMPVQIYQRPNGRLSFRGTESEKTFIAFPVGLVPYEWIEYVDLEGDEYAYVPLFYCYFRRSGGWKFWKQFLFFGYPYKSLSYYRISDVYHEGGDPADMRYSLIREGISEY